MINSQMEQENQIPQPLSRDKSHKRMTWALIIAFILVNVFMVVAGTMTPEGAERVAKISEIVLWFDFACFGIIGTYFGVDLAVYLFPRR